MTIVGARPQFIKAAPVSRILRSTDYVNQGVVECLVHTGQHYDYNMSGVFFDELDIPRPDYNLSIVENRHGAMTGRMLAGIEQLLIEESPDWVLVYGDTNSTLAGALAAAKLHIPVAHVEAGLRSFNMRMPEEVNRVLTDHISGILFCPTQTAAANLHKEGIRDGVHQVGDVMYDAILFYRVLAGEKSRILEELNLDAKRYALATCHRAENTDDPERLRRLLLALGELSSTLPVVLPLHPRTRGKVAQFGFNGLLKKIQVVDPVAYLDMVALEEGARLILTDSGGVQKEAFFLEVPCITLRAETEWVETVGAGWNRLVDVEPGAVLQAAETFLENEALPIGGALFGNGEASRLIVQLLTSPGGR